MRSRLASLVAGVFLTLPAVAQKEAPAEKPKDAQAPVAKAAPLKVGDTVDPALKLRDIDGKEVSFQELRGKVVFIHFWSTTCPWEKAAEPKMEKIESDFAKDVVGIAINSNQGEIGPDPQAAKADGGAAKEKGADKEKPAASDEKTYPKVRAKLEKAGLKFRVFVDHGNKVSDLFQAATTPHSYVIDQKGVLRYAGALDGTAEKNDRAYVREAIEAVLAGKEVKDKETKPYG